MYLADTSFFISFFNSSDKNSARAQEIFTQYFLNCSKAARPFSTDYILDETITTIRRKKPGRPGYEDAVRAAKMIMESTLLDFRYIEEADIASARARYVQHADKTLSFTDWTSVAIVQRLSKHGVISFDDDFDKLGVKRVF